MLDLPMRYWLRGKFAGFLTFLLITALVAGGLGWVTLDALRLEQEKWQERADAHHTDRLHLALWQLDARMAPVLAREDSRPYNHFSAVFAPSRALQTSGKPYPTGTVLELSPLVGADLPDWVALHFQADTEFGWTSPEVLSPSLSTHCAPVLGMNPATAPAAAAASPPVPAPDRGKILKDLSGHLKPAELFARLLPFDDAPRQDNTTVVMTNPTMNQLANAVVPQQGQMVLPYVQPPAPADKQQQDEQQQKIDPGFRNRAGVKSRVQQEMNYRGNNNDDSSTALANTWANGERWFSRNLKKSGPRSEQISVGLGSMVPLWLTDDDGRDRLVVARLVHIGDKQVCQGLLLDWGKLQETLAQEVAPLFPEAHFIPVHAGVLSEDNTTGAMTSLPVILDPGPRPVAVMPTWTPLQIGLALAWAAALVALLAVGLGGWTLLELSARRIRFVSAVTHELRTPLTTLRLYLDMLTGGIVQDEAKKTEYLHTLHAETERLNRLVGNVLDFSRLENQRPRLDMSAIHVSELLEQVRDSWQSRCEGCEKILIVEDRTSAEKTITTDVRLVPQVLGNLIDNACKYSADAEDRRIWLRAFAEGGKLVLEVEDRGPGVPAREQRAIFRAFRRGRGSDTTGGVGLGLALAQRWAGVLGGRLTLRPAAQGTGACFRLELPGG